MIAGLAIALLASSQNATIKQQPDVWVEHVPIAGVCLSDGGRVVYGFSDGKLARWTVGKGIETSVQSAAPVVCTPDGERCLCDLYVERTDGGTQHDVILWEHGRFSPAVAQAWPTGISADGSTVVGACDRGGRSLALKWTKSARLTTLPSLSKQHADSVALCCSADGTVVFGNTSTDTWTSEEVRYANRRMVSGVPFSKETVSDACTWSASGSPRLLTPTGKRDLQTAYACTDDGKTVLLREGNIAHIEADKISWYKQPDEVQDAFVLLAHSGIKAMLYQDAGTWSGDKRNQLAIHCWQPGKKPVQIKLPEGGTGTEALPKLCMVLVLSHDDSALLVENFEGQKSECWIIHFKWPS